MARTNPRRVIRLSTLARARVVTESGDDLGRLVDLRAGERRSMRGRAGHACVSGLVCGTLGLLERFGLRAPGERCIAWGRVVGVEAGQIVVRDRARPTR